MTRKEFWMGALLVGATAIATDARSWAVGKLLDAITPAAGWSAASLRELPWGSIIGVPVFIVAALWLLWDAFGRASFRACFGTERALNDFVSPLQRDVADIRKQIDGLFSALSAIRDRERLASVAEEVELAANSIYKLANEHGKLSGGQELLLQQFEGEWTNAYSYWLSIARPYAEGTIDRLLAFPEDAFERDFPNTSNFETQDVARLYQAFCARMEAWREALNEIEEKVEDAAFYSRRRLGATGETTPQLLD